MPIEFQNMDLEGQLTYLFEQLGAVDERLDGLSDRQLKVEKDCILLGISRQSNRTNGSRLTEAGRLAAQQMIRVLNAALADTGFDAKSLKSYVHCAQIFEPEFTSIINQLEPEGEGG